MDLRELLGEDYKDGMTLEDVNKLLEGKTFVDPSTLPKSVSKEVFDKTASELASYKRELRKLQEEHMTADERLKAELENAKLAQATYAKEINKLKAKEIFLTGGLEEAEYASVLDMVVSEDGNATVAKATQLMGLIKARNEITEKKVKLELLKGTPTPKHGDPAQVGTLDKAIEDARDRGDYVLLASLTRQQQQLKQSQSK